MLSFSLVIQGLVVRRGIERARDAEAAWALILGAWKKEDEEV
jgi:hypothetical protein